MYSPAFYRVGAWFAGRLPHGLARQITNTITIAQYPFRIRSRRSTGHNLRIIANGSAHANGTDGYKARRVFTNFGQSIYSFLELSSIGREELMSRCDYNGLDELVQKLSQKSGFIMVGPHMGPWELGGACLGALGLPINTVALPHPSAAVTEFFERTRARFNVRCVSANDPTETLQQALRRGENVALLIDRPYTEHSGRFEWLGQSVELPIGHAALAVRCNVPVVTVVVLFDGERRFKFLYGGPHYPDRNGSYRHAIIDLQKRCLSDMESFIRSHPEQWFRFERL